MFRPVICRMSFCLRRGCVSVSFEIGVYRNQRIAKIYDEGGIERDEAKQAAFFPQPKPLQELIFT